ncbi:LysR family transcriptional regulator [Salicibibacter cibi]|uniref:LysR family transcriptional regulator n=1 Tax=Salicibibacter cibi TaxID=2743001 RepID=A0A7T6ZEC4_9BACI|nr:LysR family transcriptional regulator [Salicibibacter cibi]QQK81939.1 LysR family transcriptional regulator [Salicibibacter cibi]
MDIKQLITFKTAANNLNFTKTAEILNFAQSSVTSQIKTLENELGVTLFERLGKRLILTEYGKQYKSYADKIVKLSQEAEWSINDYKETKGTLIIGAQESQCTYRLPPILKEFKERYPQVKLVFKPAHSDKVARQGLEQGQLDIALITDISKPADVLEVESLIQEQIKLVAFPEHPLVHKKKIKPNDLENETLLLTESGCSYRTILEEALYSSGTYPKNKLEFVSIEAIKQCVIAGLGIAALPAMVVDKEIKLGTMRELVLGNDTNHIYTHLAWHKDKEMTPPFQAFIELTREKFHSYKAS